MDPFWVRAWGLGWLGFGLQLGRNSRFGVAWVGSVGRVSGFGRSVGLVGSGRSGALGQGVGLVVGSGWQVIRSGRLGELLRARGQNVKGLGGAE